MIEIHTYLDLTGLEKEAINLNSIFAVQLPDAKIILNDLVAEEGCWVIHLPTYGLVANVKNFTQAQALVDELDAWADSEGRKEFLKIKDAEKLRESQYAKDFLRILTSYDLRQKPLGDRLNEARGRMQHIANYHRAAQEKTE